MKFLRKDWVPRSSARFFIEADISTILVNKSEYEYWSSSGFPFTAWIDYPRLSTDDGFKTGSTYLLKSEIVLYRSKMRKLL